MALSGPLGRSSKVGLTMIYGLKVGKEEGSLGMLGRRKLVVASIRKGIFRLSCGGKRFKFTLLEQREIEKEKKSGPTSKRLLISERCGDQHPVGKCCANLCGKNKKGGSFRKREASREGS